MESDRRTKVPWSSWSKGLLAFSVLIATGIVVFTTVDEQSMYVSVEEVVSGDYQNGANLQVHGTITQAPKSRRTASGGFGFSWQMSG